MSKVVYAKGVKIKENGKPYVKMKTVVGDYYIHSANKDRLLRVCHQPSKRWLNLPLDYILHNKQPYVSENIDKYTSLWD